MFYKLCLTNLTKRSFVELSFKNLFATWNISNQTQLDLDYLCDPLNEEEISENISQRKGVGNIKLVNAIKDKLKDNNKETVQHFYEELLKIPNKTHPLINDYKDDPKIIKYVGDKKSYSSPPKEFYEITKYLGLVRTDQLGNVSINRSYYLLGEMVELERALIRYTLNKLFKNKFELVSVPDILPQKIIESCGMSTKGERNQVYSICDDLDGENLCLSGTSEMALAGLFTNQILNEENLPKKVCAVSRCFRAETSSTAEERGIYRVHEFTKVEMFVISNPQKSDDILEEIRQIEEGIFGDLGLHFKVLDMPPHELGAPAYRKYDIEAWLPGRNVYGEISSCSNCTDYQSRRLNIKYSNKGGSETNFVHTLNGTACAIPRMLIALIETFQTDRDIKIPQPLQKYMKNKDTIGKQKNIPPLKFIKNKK